MAEPRLQGWERIAPVLGWTVRTAIRHRLELREHKAIFYQWLGKPRGKQSAPTSPCSGFSSSRGKTARRPQPGATPHRATHNADRSENARGPAVTWATGPVFATSPYQPPERLF